MEIAADDQMRHAEAPSDEEMEQMFHQTTQEEIVEENRKSAEREAFFAEQDAHQYCSPPRGCKACRDAWSAPLSRRPRYNRELTSAENTAEQLADIERGNFEASRNNHSRP